MQEQTEVQGAGLQQLEQALQQRLDRLEARLGAKLQAQLVTLTRLIGETAAVRPAPAAVPRPQGDGASGTQGCGR